jgi:hypothetical protein
VRTGSKLYARDSVGSDPQSSSPRPELADLALYVTHYQQPRTNLNIRRLGPGALLGGRSCAAPDSPLQNLRGAFNPFVFSERDLASRLASLAIVRLRAPCAGGRIPYGDCPTRHQR